VKVLVLHSELGVLWGGGENFTRNLFTAFAERGHSVTAAFVADRYGRYPVTLPSSIEAIPMPGWWSRKLGQAKLSSVARYLPLPMRGKWDRVQEAICWRTIRWHNRRFQRRVEQEFSDRWTDFDAIYVHCDEFLADELMRVCPTVLMLPGPVTVDRAPMLRRIQAVCSNGDALRQIKEFLGEDAIELPLGINRDLFRPETTSIRSVLGWADEDQVIGYVGRLTHLKGVDILATAFHEVSQTVPHARLLIVGGGEEEGNLRSFLARELALGIVHIKPGLNHEELPDWYRAMDILVMPSRYENLSNSILEAMACGVPFLATDVGGNRIYAETGAGWLVEPECISSLTTGLKSAVENHAEIEARGEIGSRYARANCSWMASAERLEAIIESRLGVKR